jgi:hypothetical protein
VLLWLLLLLLLPPAKGYLAEAINQLKSRPDGGRLED